jgi:RNA polymerase sigma factor (sigma-70 family)
MSLEKEQQPLLELISRVRAGDPQQIEILYQSFLEIFRYRVESRLRRKPNRDRALEAMDYLGPAFDCLVHGIQSGNLKDPEKLWAFAGGIVRNCLRDRRKPIFLPLPSHQGSEFHQPAGQLGALEAKERDQQFAAAFAQLHESDRDLLSRVYFQGQPYEQIEQELKLSSEALWARISRAKRRFRQFVDQQQTPRKVICMPGRKYTCIVPESVAA